MATQEDQIEVFAPILTKGRTDGVLWVEGKITGPDLDGDLQRMDADWLKTAVPEWATIGNVREAHNPQRPVGKAVEVWDTPDGSWYMRAKIIDKDAAEKVEHGVYNGFSIGIKGATIIKTQDAPNGTIRSGRIVETSLADRPCLATALLTIAKADARGKLQLVEDPTPVDVPKSVQVGAAIDLLTYRYITKSAGEGSETPDITGARAAIAAILPLVQHEIDGLTAGEQAEQYDVADLLTALSALTSFLASEVAESQEDKMDAATKTEIAELVKAEVKTELAEQLAAHSTSMVETLTKALKPEPVEGAAAELIEGPDIGKMVTAAVTAAMSPVTDALAGLTVKVDGIPVGGGPAITRTVSTPAGEASTEKQELLAYAGRPGLDPAIRERTLAKAASL